MALTPQQEQFAQGCVWLTNQSAAYRQSYQVAPDAPFTTVSAAASRLAADPEVAARIQFLRDEAAAKTAIPALATRIIEMREMETADVNDIISIRYVACRHCHGIDHFYQWNDELEYAQAVDVAIKAAQAHPDMSGGFGYNGLRPPHENCPRCWGVGMRHVDVADTTKLTRGARRLYKGVKIKGNGDMEILLHDQQKVTDMLNRIQGAYKDGVVLLPGAAAAAEVAKAAEAKTGEDRQRSYLRVVSG